MPKKVHNKIVGQKLMDGNLEVEDVTSVTIPDIEFTADEYDVSGLAAAFEAIDPTHVNAMTFSISHNNGTNCQQLNSPKKHHFEFRLAQQALNTAKGDTGYQSVKYRVDGMPKKISDGTAERGNPLGTTVDYTVLRFEKEVAGKVVTLIDALSNIIKINDVDYTSQINQLLS